VAGVGGVHLGGVVDGVGVVVVRRGEVGVMLDQQVQHLQLTTHWNQGVGIC